MSNRRRAAAWSSSSGQSLIETALLVPVFLLLVLNTLNFAYYFLVGIHLASAPREGVQYSIMGFYTPGTLPLPAASAVKDLTRSDMSAMTTSASASIRVCTSAGGLGTTGSGTSLRANCAPVFGPSATFTGPDPDPEAPLFVLNRVDVQYTISPLIPATPFGIVDITTVLPQFHRQVSMRQM